MIKFAGLTPRMIVLISICGLGMASCGRPKVIHKWWARERGGKPSHGPGPNRRPSHRRI